MPKRNNYKRSVLALGQDWRRGRITASFVYAEWHVNVHRVSQAVAHALS